ncbi:MAG TPA: TetR/AcrR family transcriptional regulator [Cyanobacteria bacterium UBA8530]|nr:TetR/AcrR family transcriptional regulator [Cyanobacteria bacterium UBA8530]
MDNRTRILQEALRLFSNRGYEAVGVQEICEAAEITKPTLYHYFGNKIGLLEAILHHWGVDFDQRVSVAAEYHGDLPLTLNRLVKAFFELAALHPEFYRLQLALWFAPPESEAGKTILPSLKRQHDSIEALFRKAADDHGNMRGRDRIYAISFLGLVNSYAAIFLNNLTQLDDELCFRILHHFMHGIYS